MTEYTNWCRDLMATLSDGGTWGIPRNGLVFTRRGNALVLVARMPHDPAMSISATELREYQDSQYAETKYEFEAAGFEVRNEIREEE